MPNKQQLRRKKSYYDLTPQIEQYHKWAYAVQQLQTLDDGELEARFVEFMRWLQSKGQYEQDTCLESLRYFLEHGVNIFCKVPLVIWQEQGISRINHEIILVNALRDDELVNIPSYYSPQVRELVNEKYEQCQRLYDEFDPDDYYYLSKLETFPIQLKYLNYFVEYKCGATIYNVEEFEKLRAISAKLSDVFQMVCDIDIDRERV